MRGSSVPGKKHVQGNPLEFHLRMFAAVLREAGYRDRAVCSKLGLLADLGHWLKRTGQSFASNLEEHLLEAFVKHKQRMQQMHRGDSRTLQQFLAHLRKKGVVSSRKLIPDQSPLARILGCYEQHLLLERRLASATVFNYLSFARKFLVDCFPEGSFHLKEIKVSDISDFVLRHGPRMSVGTAQNMTTAFRSFFRYLFQKGELQADLAACVPAVADWRSGSHPLFLSVRGFRRACTCARLPADTGGAQQAPRTAADRFSQPSRNRCVARRPESFHLDGASRSSPPSGCGPDRSTSFRVDWVELPRCRSGDGCPRALPRKGEKTALHPTPSRNGKDARCLATRTPRSARRSPISQHPSRQT
jgi:hypothetical protein